MSLSPKTKRKLWTIAIVFLILAAAGGILTWQKFFREEPQVFTNEAEQFKYGSLGAEGDRGIPYYLWLVLPRVFSRSNARAGRLSTPSVWYGKKGQEIPVGFSKKVVGFARITNNCAICHTATYRAHEDETPHVVVGGAGTRQQPSSHASLSVQSCTRPALQQRHDHE